MPCARRFLSAAADAICLFRRPPACFTDIDDDDDILFFRYLILRRVILRYLYYFALFFSKHPPTMRHYLILPIAAAAISLLIFATSRLFMALLNHFHYAILLSYALLALFFSFCCCLRAAILFSFSPLFLFAFSSSPFLLFRFFVILMILFSERQRRAYYADRLSLILFSFSFRVFSFTYMLRSDYMLPDMPRHFHCCRHFHDMSLQRYFHMLKSAARYIFFSFLSWKILRPRAIEYRMNITKIYIINIYIELLFSCPLSFLFSAHYDIIPLSLHFLCLYCIRYLPKTCHCFSFI